MAVELSFRAELHGRARLSSRGMCTALRSSERRVVAGYSTQRPWRDTDVLPLSSFHTPSSRVAGTVSEISAILSSKNASRSIRLAFAVAPALTRPSSMSEAVGGARSPSHQRTLSCLRIFFLTRTFP